MTFEMQILTRLTLAALLGAMVGIERELKHKPIGLRTNMLIAMTGALVMILAIAISSTEGDQGAPRLAAALIQGLGFLGAGAIIRERGAVTGLTTAAVLLLVASIGLAAGAGAWLLAITVTAITLFVLTAFGYIEKALHTKCQTVTYSFKTADSSQLLTDLNRVLGEKNVHLHGAQVISDGDGQKVEFAVCIATDFDTKLVTRVLKSGGDTPKGHKEASE